jgi:hypothetical protein
MGEAESDMGIALGDADGDGDFDVFVAHRIFETHTLWTQESPGMFVDRTSTSGIISAAWRGTGFGTVMSDLDNDGDLDLVLTNGRVLRSAGEQLPAAQATNAFWRPYAQRDQVFLNEGDGRFRDVSERNADFSAGVFVGRGLACGDVNNDGKLDVLVNRTAASARLFMNVSANAGHWLIVRAVDPALRRDAYGARVRVQAGQRSFVRCINPGYSFLSSNDPRAHFGLGAAAEYDRVHVIWPDGSEEWFPAGRTNRVLVLRRGDGVEEPL